MIERKNLLEKIKQKYVGLAILAAVLYGISAPFSKILLQNLQPVQMAALLYLGAGLGMGLLQISIGKLKNNHAEARLTGKELPYVVAMILLDIAAPICLMLGLTMTTASNAALLNNFEIVATAVIASFFFGESLEKRMWWSISFITIASIILSVNNGTDFSFSKGSLLVLLACICWGLENNCTGKLSIKDPIQIVVIKGMGSGLGALLISLRIGEHWNFSPYLLGGLLLGFISYGLGIFVYILAQRHLGAARTSGYYATAPFIGVVFSWVLLKDPLTLNFIIALAIMLIGTYLSVTERHGHKHIHERETHDHRHNHQDGHHDHVHTEEVKGEHSHPHTHEKVEHNHPHLPDFHHRHNHS